MLVRSLINHNRVLLPALNLIILQPRLNNCIFFRNSPQPAPLAEVSYIWLEKYIQKRELKGEIRHGYVRLKRYAEGMGVDLQKKLAGQNGSLTACSAMLRYT